MSSRRAFGKRTPLHHEFALAAISSPRGSKSYPARDLGLAQSLSLMSCTSPLMDRASPKASTRIAPKKWQTPPP